MMPSRTLSVVRDRNATPPGTPVRPSRYRRAIAWLRCNRDVLWRGAKEAAFVVLLAAVVYLGARVWELKAWIGRNPPAPPTASVVRDMAVVTIDAAHAREAEGTE